MKIIEGHQRLAEEYKVGHSVLSGWVVAGILFLLLCAGLGLYDIISFGYHFFKNLFA